MICPSNKKKRGKEKKGATPRGAKTDGTVRDSPHDNYVQRSKKKKKTKNWKKSPSQKEKVKKVR